VDFVTHAAVGALAGRALTPAAADADEARALVRLGALAALLPDADHVLEVCSPELYLVYHRTASHSLLGVAVLALAAAWPGSPAARRRRVAVAGAALATHLALDVATPFGTALLWPFSGWMAATDGLPIVAPWMILLTLLLAAGAAWRGREAPLAGRRFARGALVGLGLLLAATHALSAWGARATPGGAELCVPVWQLPYGADALHAEGPDLVHYRLVPGRDPREVARYPRVASEDGGPLPRARAPVPPGAPLARMRLPIARVGSEVVTHFDAQFLLIDPSRRPIRVVAPCQPPLSYEVRQTAPGAQLLLWAAVVLASWALTRTRRASPSGDREP